MQYSITGAVFPIGFVLLYGSGFVASKAGLPYANPLSFLSWRFVLAAGVLLLLAWLTANVKKHSWLETVHISVAGVLTVGVFSIGSFVAMDNGLSPGLCALITALQPVLVGVLAGRVVGERLLPQQWLGLLLGLVGVTLVIYQNIEFDSAGIFSVVMAVLALLGLTLGNLYQKRYCADMDLFTGGAIQAFASAVVCIALLLVFGSYELQWQMPFIGSLAYMTLGVSVGALSLLYVLIRNGAVSKVASWFYLMPVVAVLGAYWLFDEVMSWQSQLGILVVIAGVALAQKPRIFRRENHGPRSTNNYPKSYG